MTRRQAPFTDARRYALRSGAIAAALIGFVHMALGTRFGGSLIVFYLTGSRVTARHSCVLLVYIINACWASPHF